jgi:hypothetical protein
MNKVIYSIALALIFGLYTAQAQTTNRSNDAIIEQLKRATQELLDAVAPGV